MDKHIRHKSTSPGRQEAHPPGSSRYDYAQDNYAKEPKRSRNPPRQEPAAPRSRSRNPDQPLLDEEGWSSRGDPYSEHLPASRGKRGDRYQGYEPTERSRNHWDEDAERVVRRKEKPVRPPPPKSPRERDKAWDRGDKQESSQDLEYERHLAKEQQRRDREQNHRTGREAGRDGERLGERGHSWDRQRQRDRERNRARTRSRERELEDDYRHSSSSSREPRASWEEEGDDGEWERSARGRQRVHSGPEEVFEDKRGDAREVWDSRQGEGAGRKRSHTHTDDDAGTSAAGLCVCVGCWRGWLLWKPQVAGLI